MFGVGIDLCRIDRVQRLFDLYGARFLRRAYHESEILHFQELPLSRRPTFLAGRWAVKEACLKAAGVRLLFPEIVSLPSAQSGTRFKFLVLPQALIRHYLTLYILWCRETRAQVGRQRIIAICSTKYRTWACIHIS